MQFIDLATQYQKINTSVQRNINNVLEHGKFILGPEVKELEEKLATFVNVNHAITCANGTDALQLALMALELAPGDEVITTPLSFFASVEVTLLLGLTPIFVDIEPDTYLIDATKIESAITSKTKAILAVSLYGQCPDFDTINTIAKKHNIPVIEDAAQSFGATLNNTRSCGLTTIGCTSFFPSKPLGCYGDGGAVFTNNDTIANKITVLRTHGQTKRYQHDEIGLNSRLDTIQAAVLLAKLDIFEQEIRQRQQVAQNYHYAFIGTEITPPTIAQGRTSVFGQYTIAVPNRESFCTRLKENGIPTAIHYPKALHQQSAVTNYLNKTDSFPHAEKAAQHVVSLPMHPYLEEKEQAKIINTAKQAITKTVA